MFCSCAIRSCVSLKVASSPADLAPPPAAALALKPIEDLANHVPQQSMASTGTPGGPGPATTARTWRCDTPSPPSVPAGQPSPASDMHSPTVLASQSSTAADSMVDADTLIDRLSLLGHAAEPLNRSTSLESESWPDAQPLQDVDQDFRDSDGKDLFGDDEDDDELMLSTSDPYRCVTPPRIEDLTSEPDDDELVHHFRKAGVQNTEPVASSAVAGAVPAEPVAAETAEHAHVPSSAAAASVVHAHVPSSAAAASVEHAHVLITAAEAAAAVEREQGPLPDDSMHGKDKRLIRLRSSSCIEHGEMLMRISQYDQEFAISGTSIEARRERKRVLAHLNREIAKAPAEVLQRWEVDRHTHSGLNQFMKEWQQDPTWGTMVQTERRRNSTLKRFDRQVSWRTEAQLRADFGDEEATGMMSHKKKSKDQVRKNPNNPTTLQYAVIVDESLRRAEVAEDTEWEATMDHTGSDLAVAGEIANMMALTENINTWDDDEEEEEKKPETAGGPPEKKPRATPTKKEPRAKDEDGAPVFFGWLRDGPKGLRKYVVHR